MLLLDEIEKAHPDLFNVLLQVMDHGSLTDANGRKVDFRNVILIMTTNAGASDMAKAPMGFGRERREGEDTEAINKMFTPEFRNRLDAVVGFNNLPPEVVVRVVEKFILELELQLSDRNVIIEVDRKAMDWLVEQGYDPLMGPARWRGLFRKTSRSRSPMNYCSANCKMVALCRSVGTRKPACRLS